MNSPHINTVAERKKERYHSYLMSRFSAVVDALSNDSSIVRDSSFVGMTNYDGYFHYVSRIEFQNPADAGQTVQVCDATEAE